MFKIKTISNNNPLLNQVKISNTDSSFKAVIFPNLGASLQQLKYNKTEVIHGITPDEDGLATYRTKFNSSLLFPFPSRIDNGTYSFKGKHYSLDCNEVGAKNALHGHVHNKPFTLAETILKKDFAELKMSYEDPGSSNGFPFPYKIEITYRFFNNNCQLEVNITNIGSNSFPFGIGWHPYFKTDDLKSSILDFYAEKQHFLNEKMIPEKEIPLKIAVPFRVGQQFLDDCFVLKSSRAMFQTTEYSLVLKFSSPPPTSFLQTYTPPDRNCIAIEPMTCAGNSFNNKNGLMELTPNMSYYWSIDISIQPHKQ